MYLTSRINKVFFLLVLTLAATGAACQKADADSFEQLRRLRGQVQGAPTQQLYASWARLPMPPTAIPEKYTGQHQAGTIQTAMSQLNLTNNSPANVAKQMQSAIDPHPALGLNFTMPTMKPAHFGPPQPGDLPFHMWNMDQGTLKDMAPATMQYAFPGTGAPPSDYVSAASMLTAGVRLGQNIIQPSYPTDQAAFQGKLEQAERASGQAAENSFSASQTILRQSLINVANEQAAVPFTAGSQDKTLPQAIWMVQKLFKTIFLPMAVLLILPGAIIVQVKGAMLGTFSHAAMPDADTLSPFAGILRSIVAIFMIPATQLVISYSIDIGNSLTYEVQTFIDSSSVSSWSAQQTVGTPPANQQQEQEQEDNENTATAMAGSIFNEVNMLLNYALTVLIAYQTVMMCYLFLMGPIAAAFFAWPNGVGRLFKIVLGSWLDAVTNLALWRFWWCIILLCMSTRIHWLQEIGQYNAQDPWERAVYTAFMVMLTYVPFNPFDFRPGDLVDSMLQKAGIKSSGQ